jgi:hypothetical protein
LQLLGNGFVGFHLLVKRKISAKHTVRQSLSSFDRSWSYLSFPRKAPSSFPMASPST